MEKQIIDADTAIQWIVDVIAELDEDCICDVFNHVCSGKLRWLRENQFEFTPPEIA